VGCGVGAVGAGVGEGMGAVGAGVDDGVGAGVGPNVGAGVGGEGCARYRDDTYLKMLVILSRK